MHGIDKSFFSLANEVKGLSEMEIYYRIRKAFDAVPYATRKSCMDFFNQFGFWGRLDPEKGIYEEIEGKADALFAHMDDFVWVYEHLADYRSRKTLYAILNNWYRYDFTTTAQTKEVLFDDYFDLDLVRCSRREVFVDLGAFVGDTVLSYLANYGEDCYQKIYCYEITPETFVQLQKNVGHYPNIDLRQKGVGDQSGTLALLDSQGGASANTLGQDGKTGTVVEMTTLDEDIQEPITLLKADIEGFEQKAIRGAQRHIREDHPRLLLSVYHNNEDLWKIPQMIHQLAADYRFYLRYHGSPIYPTEITLLAL